MESSEYPDLENNMDIFEEGSESVEEFKDEIDSFFKMRNLTLENMKWIFCNKQLVNLRK